MHGKVCKPKDGQLCTALIGPVFGRPDNLKLTQFHQIILIRQGNLEDFIKILVLLKSLTSLAAKKKKT